MSGKKLSETLVNLVLVLSGAALWLAAQKIEVGAAMGQGGDFMPKLCSTIWLIIAVLLFVFGLKNPDTGKNEPGISLKGFLMTLALLFIYVLLLKPIGFVITSIVYMFIQMMLFVPAELRSKKNYVIFAIVSVVLPIAVNLLFVNVFSLILPTGIL